MQTIKSVRALGRNALLFISGQTVSGIGDMAQLVGLSMYVYKASNNIYAVSSLYALEALSMIICGQLGGLFADNWDRKRSLAVLQALQAMLIAAIPFAGKGLPLYALFFVFTVCTSISRIFQSAISGDVVAPEHFEKFQGIYSSLRSSTVVIGPVIGTWLFSAYGTNMLFGFNALSFILCAITTSFISDNGSNPAPQSKAGGSPELSEKKSAWRQWIDGYRVLLSNSDLAAVVLSMPVVMLGTGVLNSVFIGISTDLWRFSDKQYGFVMAASGLGGILGGILYGSVHPKFTAKGLFHFGILAKAICLLAVSYIADFFAVFFLLIANGIFFSFVSSVAQVLLMKRTLPRERGRVSGIANSLAFIAMLCGSSASGFLVAYYGYRTTIAVVIMSHLLCGFAFWLIGSRQILQLREAGVPSNA